MIDDDAMEFFPEDEDILALQVLINHTHSSTSTICLRPPPPPPPPAFILAPPLPIPNR